MAKREEEVLQGKQRMKQIMEDTGVNLRVELKKRGICYKEN